MNVAELSTSKSSAESQVQALTEMLVAGAVRAVGGAGPDQGQMAALAGATAAIGFHLLLKQEASLDPLALPPDVGHPFARETFSVFQQACAVLTMGRSGDVESMRDPAWKLVRAFFDGSKEVAFLDGLSRAAFQIAIADRRLGAEAVAQLAEVVTVAAQPWVHAGVDLNVNDAMFKVLYLTYRRGAHLELLASRTCGGNARQALIDGGYAGALALASMRLLTHCNMEIASERQAPGVSEKMAGWARGGGGLLLPAVLWTVMEQRDEILKAARTKYADLWDEIGRAIPGRMDAVSRATVLRGWRACCLTPKDPGAREQLAAALAVAAQEVLALCGHRRPAASA